MEKNYTIKREENLIETARENPGSLYDEQYYNSDLSDGNTQAYGRQEPWASFFGNIAEQIVRDYRPASVADIGCAFGLLTEALVDRGVDAHGFDISPYAISQARRDMVERLSLHSITDPIPLRLSGKYDLAICIEVLEHLPPEQIDSAIANLCACADRIIFSSSPDDFDEPTHFCVLPTETWLEKFAKHGFFPAKRDRAAKYIAPQARCVENKNAKPYGLNYGLIRTVRKALNRK